VLTEVGNFPGVAAARAHALERVRGILGDTKTDELVARGSAMSYDALVDCTIGKVDLASGRRRA
jgi:hypothetical protein